MLRDRGYEVVVYQRTEFQLKRRLYFFEKQNYDTGSFASYRQN